MSDEINNVIEILKQKDGIMRLREAKSHGIREHVMYKLYSQGIVVKEGRGLYRLAEIDPPGNPDLVQISLLIPKAVICLISALYLHGLTTQIPYKVHIALPRNIPKPRIQFPPIDVIWLSEKPYKAGIENVAIDGEMVKVYSREKTVADCFKFRKKIGEDVAIEALKDYIQQCHLNIARLMEFARINRVEKLMKPYLEALM